MSEDLTFDKESLKLDRVKEVLAGLPDDTEISLGVLMRVQKALKEKDKRISELEEALNSCHWQTDDMVVRCLKCEEPFDAHAPDCEIGCALKSIGDDAKRLLRIRDAAVAWARHRDVCRHNDPDLPCSECFDTHQSLRQAVSEMSKEKS